MKQNTHGFTIVELLIVIVVIGILAAISIVAYNGISNRANDSAVQSDLKNIATKISLYQAEHGALPSGAQMAPLGIKVTKSAYSTSEGLHYNPPPCWGVCL